MREAPHIEVAATRPEIPAVLRAQGIPASASPGERILELARKACGLYESLAAPRALLAEIRPEDFAEVFRGEGRNASETPLDGILPGASRLVLFATTVGPAVCDEIARLFDANEPALGAMLDSVASEATELASQRVESRLRDRLRLEGGLGPEDGLLAFSPGYCGWHVSGQRRLFAALRPEEIGITLNESCLMRPLKSISGVLVAAPKPVFEFEDDYPFCEACHDHSCLERLRQVQLR